MAFKQVQLICSLVVVASVYIILGSSQNINERFEKGIIVKKSILKKFLWIKKNEVYISYVSLIFVIIGYIYLFALIPYNIICFVFSNNIAVLIARFYIAVTMSTVFIERFFLPPYGTRGN